MYNVSKIYILYFQIACIIAIACSLLNSIHSPGIALTFFNVVFITALVFSLITLLFRVAHIYETFSETCSFTFEAILCLIFGLTCFAASCWMVRFGGSRDGRLVIALASGFVAAFGYFIDSFALFQARRSQRSSKEIEV